MTPEEMKDRTKRFALRIVRLVAALPDNKVCFVMGRQLLRAGTSVGANYRASCRARSAADFINKMGVVEEECDEVLYWLDLLVESKQINPPDVSDLVKEGNQLLSILVASIRTARKNARTTPLSQRKSRQLQVNAEGAQND